MSTRPNTAPHPPQEIIYVVDDDEAMRDSLEFLLESVQLPSRSFPSAQAFLDEVQADWHGCLLLDVRMPGMSGLDLQAELNAREIPLPVVIMTAYADVPMAIRAMHQGAVDFIEKPFNEQTLLDRIHQALEQHRALQERRVQRDRAVNLVERLTPREREVMALVVKGRLNKQIAGDLNLSQKTVEQHRARVMEKMEAESLAGLVRLSIAAGEN
ncbi:MAG: response regulator [Acidobacteriota bacterium]